MGQKVLRLLTMRVYVETYSGYKGDERPARFQVGTVTWDVRQVTDRWYGPDHDWFKVEASDGRLYVLRRHRVSGEWDVFAVE